ncbi:hypothetical protein F4804DRAFT_22204 [Jackrogersella minutella]|nr:hypothetical protein F4804DRAFT_22204 [Jackrogersella minutella]
MLWPQFLLRLHRVFLLASITRHSVTNQQRHTLPYYTRSERQKLRHKRETRNIALSRHHLDQSSTSRAAQTRRSTFLAIRLSRD